MSIKDESTEDILRELCSRMDKIFHTDDYRTAVYKSSDDSLAIRLQLDEGVSSDKFIESLVTPRV